jgi:hypothetical protein
MLVSHQLKDKPENGAFGSAARVSGSSVFGFTLRSREHQAGWAGIDNRIEQRLNTFVLKCGACNNGTILRAVVPFRRALQFRPRNFLALKYL